MDKNEERYGKIGLRIAYYRKYRHLTQERLAEQANTTAGNISNIETRSVPISLAMLFALADAMDIPPYKLLQFDDLP